MAPRRAHPDTPAGHRSPCPLAAALDVVGDKWTLVILRDMLFGGCSRYNEFLKGPEGITTNILADRLKRMQLVGLIESRAYTDSPPRHAYHLTRMGAELLPVIAAIAQWGNRHIDGTWRPTPQMLRDAKRRLRKQFTDLKV